MKILALPRKTIQTSLSVVRAPLHAVALLLPGDTTGPQGKTKRAIDRLDARLRGTAATVMFDPALHNDARERKASVMESTRAARRANVRRKRESQN
jgi:hypothetical protein